MAIFIPGVAVSQASGRVGGTIFSRNRGGAYMRNGSIPTTVTTLFAQSIKAVTAAQSQAWAGLDEGEREQWAEWAAQNPVINRLGQSRTLSGHQAYVQINARLLYAGFSAITSPPVGAAPAPFVPGVITAEAGPSVATVAYTPTPAPTGVAVQAFAYLANSPGVRYVKNRLALVTTSDAAAASPLDIAEDVEARFGTLQAGQTLHIALRALDSTSGLVSGVFYASETVV
jgi:hypothetical protein